MDTMMKLMMLQNPSLMNNPGMGLMMLGGAISGIVLRDEDFIDGDRRS